MSNQVLIEINDLTKVFGNLIANNKVNITINKHEIHALLGENGAGKSTLMNMLSGLYSPDGGSIIFEGKHCNFTAPKDSISVGIGMIHQHFKLIERLTAFENIILGNIKSILLNKKIEMNKIKQLIDKFQLTIDLNKYVADMSIGEKQILEIIKVLYRGAKLLILDEPTAVLTPQETKRLFEIMRHLKEFGCSLIFISHKLNEVMEISDRITVLRKGSSIQTLDTISTTPQELTNLMVGVPVTFNIIRTLQKYDEKVLHVNNLCYISEEGVEVLKGINFSIKKGEILGLAGIAGSGQKELCEAIAGILKVNSGKIVFKDEDLTQLNARDIINRGVSLSFIPEDRLGMGLVANLDIVENILLKHYNKQGFIINRKSVTKRAEKIIQTLDIKTASIHHPIKNMSGGNIQKLLLGRELDINPELLITAYAVRGLDIQTTFKIYDLLNEQKARGVSILYVAEDIDAMLDFCDRIMVMCNGEVTGIVDSNKTNKNKIGLMMMGRSVNNGSNS
ncbi:MAG: ATPase component of uncharacterized ABC-type transporter [Haloplasmataceae bacterium]|jgi:simple sugar transport system ATP-binding protein|nr:ATPase component of uncharacterized ABC-type transporter [Haloplasmataceae bacterium]